VAGSELVGVGDGIECRKPSTTQESRYYSVRRLGALDDYFTAPFRVVPSKSNSACCCADCNGSGSVTVDELVTGVNNALGGCP